ncbi:HSP20-like chaperone [Lasallia pustulata]|uniref:HSP20-like chaperone n=1 Tax=Lasallia pustulata TaxID=136370 RepID=A0A1W5CWE6_9LECA|nr:HSP20-like chaperone [Lasallia pustulata]
MSSTQTTPEVLWAQRSSKTDAEKNVIYLTISAPDVSPQSTKIDLKPTSLTFTGHSETKKTTYHVELEFYAEIDPENSKKNHSPRDVEFVLRKKDMEEKYWPRLLKESKKVHFLKTDFDKWVDEDEQEAVAEDLDFGGGGMPGMPGMGGMGGMGGDDGGFGGIDFSKLGMGGAGGMPGMEGLGDMEGGDEDEDMPELEDEEGVEKVETGEKVKEIAEATGETGASATKTSASKIEELS